MLSDYLFEAFISMTPPQNPEAFLRILFLRSSGKVITSCFPDMELLLIRSLPFAGRIMVLWEWHLGQTKLRVTLVRDIQLKLRRMQHGEGTAFALK